MTTKDSLIEFDNKILGDLQDLMLSLSFFLDDNPFDLNELEVYGQLRSGMRQGYRAGNWLIALHGICAVLKDSPFREKAENIRQELLDWFGS